MLRGMYPLTITLLTASVIASGSYQSILATHFELVGYASLTDIRDVDLSGNHILGAFTGGVVLVSIDAPDLPAPAGSFPTSSPCEDVILTESVAYAACGEQGVVLLPVDGVLGDDPLSLIETIGSASGIFLSQQLLIVASEDYGLEVYDIGDPAAPDSLGSLPLAGSPSDVWVSGSTAYVADTSLLLWVVDLSVPEVPVLLGSTSTLGLARDVVVREGVAIVAEDIGIVSYDVDQPTSIEPIDTVITPGRALDLALEFPRLYVADDKNGTHLFSVSSGGMFTFLSTFPPLEPAEDARGVSVRHDTLVVGEDMTGIVLVDWGDQLDPSLIALSPVPGESRGAQRTGEGLILAAEGVGGLRVLGFGENRELESLALLEVDDRLVDVEVRGSHAFSPADVAGVYVFSIADPLHPEVLGSVHTGREALEVRAFGNFIYVVDGDFNVVDVTEPDNPVVTGHLITPDGYSNDLFVSSPDLIYVANGSEGLLVVSAGDPENPVEVASFDTQGFVRGVTVENDLAALAVSDSLVLLDVSNVSGIRRLGALGAGEIVLDVVLAGEKAVLGMESGALVLADIADPESPLFIERYETSGSTLNISFSSDTLVVSDRNSLLVFSAEGLGSLPVGEPEGGPVPSIRLHQNYPNPFNPRTTIRIDMSCGTDEQGMSTLLVYDLRGRVVRRLPIFRRGGPVQVSWDGRDLHGNPVPSGMYFYSIPGANAVKKMLLIR